MANGEFIERLRQDMLKRVNKWVKKADDHFSMEVLLPYDRVVYVEVYLMGSWRYHISLMPHDGRHENFDDAETCKQEALKEVVKELRCYEETIAALSKLIKNS